MKKLILIITLVASQWCHAHIREAFQLLKEGKYDTACQLVRKAGKYAVMDARDEHENTLLIAAILYADVLDDSHDYEHKLQVVEKTIDCILDKTEYNWLYIDRRNTLWHTPLMVAAQKGFYDIAEYLYIHGANPHMKDVYGKKARDYATTKELRKALMSWEWEYQRIRYEGDNIWLLLRRGMYRAALVYDIPRISELEALSLRDKLGNSLIAGIILYSFSIDQDMSYPDKEQLLVDLMDAILEYTPDPSARTLLLDTQNRRGQTALMWAAKYGHDGIIEYLVHRDANLLLQDEKGHYASDYAQTLHLKELLEDWQMDQALSYRV